MPKIKRPKATPSSEAAKRFLDAMEQVMLEDVALYKSLCYRDRQKRLCRFFTGHEVVIGWWSGAYRIRVTVCGQTLEDENETYETEENAIYATIQEFEKHFGDSWRQDSNGQRHGMVPSPLVNGSHWEN